MRVPFSKYHGLGNDFILIDGVADPELAGLPFATRAPVWCRRHTGVGADGVLVIDGDAGDAHVRMRIVNADGSDGGMCGNGVRCVARHAAERHGWSEPTLRVRVGGATLGIEIVRTSGGGFESAIVDMGEARLTPGEIPVRVEGDRTTDIALPEGFRIPPGVERTMTCVNVGNPHAVVFCTDVDRVDISEFGAWLEREELFPERTNVQIAQVITPSRLRVRTWERGAGATMACGTGACAAAVAGAITRRCAANVDVALPGGVLGVRVEGRRVFMTGPAVHVFDGELDA